MTPVLADWSGTSMSPARFPTSSRQRASLSFPRFRSRRNAHHTEKTDGSQVLSLVHSTTHARAPFLLSLTWLSIVNS